MIPAIFNNLNNIVLKTFGMPVRLLQQTGGELEIMGCFAPSPMIEDVIPGRGTSIVRLFIDLRGISPIPAHGDRVQIGQDIYTVMEVEADTIGGGILKMRKNS